MKKLLILSCLIAAAMIAWTAPPAQADGYIHVHGRYPPVIIPPPLPHYPLFPRHYPFGRVEVEVEPKEAQVFVDGNYVGTAQKLDGWPDYLYLRQGTYEISLVHPGYETVTHKVAIFPRQRMTLEFSLVPGESTPPPSRKDAEKKEADKEEKTKKPGSD